jgi:hypothetical protein
VQLQETEAVSCQGDDTIRTHLQASQHIKHLTQLMCPKRHCHESNAAAALPIPHQPEGPKPEQYFAFIAIIADSYSPIISFPSVTR